MQLRSVMTFSDIPPMSVILGNGGSQAFLQTLNSGYSGSSIFGTARDMFGDIHNKFVREVVEPARQAIQRVRDTIKVYDDPDFNTIRSLTKIDDLANVPPMMHLPILTYGPVRKLLLEGRISGYGYDVNSIPEEDVFGRLIDNGRVDMGKWIAEGADFKHLPDIISEVHPLTDPDLSEEQLEAIENTRKLIDKVLSDTTKDPTNINDDRG